ncbi:MAG: hypothetical protein ACJ746_23410 [Bryobacteraceae bacterium]
MSFASFVSISQSFESHALNDVARAVGEELSSRRLAGNLPAGSRIAIGVGSRGISNIADIVRATVNYFREHGVHPFIIPAMGSHGGATVEGQRGVLEHYGITEASVGCPVVSSLEVIPFGTTPEGFDTCLDSIAAASDGIFLINRVKWHTSFEGPVESGLMKMCAIGLGKACGARKYHTYAAREGLGPIVLSVGRHVLRSGKVIGGLAIVEDANHGTARVSALAANEIEKGEEELLRLARSWMPRVPFDDVDVLVVDEIGKEISGTGMDSKVVNRHTHGNVNPWSWAPRIRRIYLRDLSETTAGNANGIGMADVISQRLYDKIDWHATNINGLTASNLNVIKTPLRCPNDKAALELLAGSVGRTRPEEVTVVRLRNTLELNRMWVTQNLLDGKSFDSGKPFELTFDGEGNLPQFDPNR